MEHQNPDDFYNSEAATQMVKEYRSVQVSSCQLLKSEMRLLRSLVEILLQLSPPDRQLRRQIYDRLLSCVDRLEKLC